MTKRYLALLAFSILGACAELPAEPPAEESTEMQDLDVTTNAISCNPDLPGNRTCSAIDPTCWCRRIGAGHTGFCACQ